MQVFIYGWHFLLLAVAGELLVPLLLAPFYKGYRHTTMVISSLGNPSSPVRVPFNLWMLAAGLLFLLAVPGLYGAFSPVSAPLSGVCATFLAIFAVGACVVSCFFSVNESKDVVTTASKIHGAGSAIGFVLLLFVPLFLGLMLLRAGDIAGGVLSLASFGCGLAAFVFFVIADRPGGKGRIARRIGLWQRLNLLFLYLPLAYVALCRI